MHFLFGDKVYFQFIFSRSSLSAVKRIYGLFVSVLAPWVMFLVLKGFFLKNKLFFLYCLNCLLFSMAKIPKMLAINVFLR